VVHWSAQQIARIKVKKYARCAFYHTAGIRLSNFFSAPQIQYVCWHCARYKCLYYYIIINGHMMWCLWHNDICQMSLKAAYECWNSSTPKFHFLTDLCRPYNTVVLHCNVLCINSPMWLCGCKLMWNGGGLYDIMRCCLMCMRVWWWHVKCIQHQCQFNLLLSLISGQYLYFSWVICFVRVGEYGFLFTQFPGFYNFCW